MNAFRSGAASARAGLRTSGPERSAGAVLPFGPSLSKPSRASAITAGATLRRGRHSAAAKRSPFGLGVSKPSRACTALARARPRAGRPVRSAVGGRRKAPTPLRCSGREGGCATRPLRAACGDPQPELGQSSPSLGCASGNPRGPALLGAAHSRPDLPARSLAEPPVARVVTHATRVPRPEGSALPGRIGDGEQRSPARGSLPPVAAGRRGLASSGCGTAKTARRGRVPQPPWPGEHRSAPEASPRAAPLSPGRALPSGTRPPAARKTASTGAA